jgi:peptidoglycan hydrolase-like protein with peptidoglycan-binding domain
MEKVKPNIVIALMIAAGVSISPASQAASYNPVTQKAQSKLAQLGFDPGTTDGILGRHTIAAIKAFQKKSGLPVTGALDSATQAKLAIGAPAPQVARVAQVAQVAPTPQVAQVTTVIDWRPVPTQDELDKLVANPANDSNFPYNDYRPGAPAANLGLPGAAILAAMNNSADTYGSRPPGQPKHTGEGYKYMTDCLTTGYDSTFWSDITFHYYCQMSLPRKCYTYASAGKSKDGIKYPRPAAYQVCATGKLPESPDFVAFVPKTQPQVFQYVMFGQTNAFNHEQEQAIINAFYGVKNPADPKECRLKRPLRTEDPTDGTHCLANKTMKTKLVGKGT